MDNPSVIKHRAGCLDFANHCHLRESGHYARMPRHRMRRVRPMDYLIFWALGGCGYVETEGQRHPVRAGHLVTLRPRVPHAYGSDPDPPWDVLWAHFDGALAAPLVKSIRQFGGVVVDLGQDAALRDRWEELVIVQNAGGAGAALRANTGLAALLGQLLQRLQTGIITPERTGPLDATALHRHLHEHYQDPISLSSLARLAHLSPTHFARVFKKQFGVSAMGLVIEKRITVACSLLTGSTMPIKQIGAAVGYADPYYFSRLFHRRIGMSPSCYRRNRGQGVQSTVRVSGTAPATTVATPGLNA